MAIRVPYPRPGEENEWPAYWTRPVGKGGPLAAAMLPEYALGRDWRK